MEPMVVFKLMILMTLLLMMILMVLKLVVVMMVEVDGGVCDENFGT